MGVGATPCCGLSNQIDQRRVKENSPLLFFLSLEYHEAMHEDDHTPASPSVARRLGQADFDGMQWPQTPEEGVLETCRLSDDLHEIALAGSRAFHPQASRAELESLLAEFQSSWARIQPRVQFLR
jgi:hypothetical protein